MLRLVVMLLATRVDPVCVHIYPPTCYLVCPRTILHHYQYVYQLT